MPTWLIWWIAGLLEGEGCFGCWRQSNKRGKHGTPTVTVTMADKDVIERAAVVLKSTVSGPYFHGVVGNTHGPYWTVRLQGNSAIQWMMTLYTLLGRRRQDKIRQIIDEWGDTPPRGYRSMEHYHARMAHIR